MVTLEELRTKLANDPAAQMRFLMDSLHVLDNQGVDTRDPAVLQALGIDFNLPIKQILKNLRPPTSKIAVLPGL